MKIIFAHKLFSGLLIACFIFAFLGPKPESASAVSTSVVISQVYGGGGNSGATYKNDFIEIFNRGTTAVDLTNWSVQYASYNGTTWNKTILSGTIEPGEYYLIQENKGSGGSVDLPTPDAIGAISMSAERGKVALVNNSTSLTGSCPTGVIDFVGFGSANCYETAATPALTNTTAALRKNNGCTETDNNAADFTTGSPAPRNSSSPVNVCAVDYAPEVSSTTPPDGYLNFQVSNDLEVTFNEPVDVTDGWFTLSCSPSGVHTATWSGGPTTFTINPDVDFTDADECTLTINAAQVSDQDTNDYPDKMAANEEITFNAIDNCAATTTPIGAIQGTGGTSPLAGSTVTTRGIVVGDFEGPSPALRGFNIQDTGDADPLTSNGIFIYNNNDNNNVSIGDEVVVSGAVSEYYELTEITATSITKCGTGSVPTTYVTLPVPTVDYFERFEGMLVTLPQRLVISEYFNYDRFGEIILTLFRHTTPTALFEPGSAEAAAAAQAYLLDSITLDDGRTNQNPDPAIHPNGLTFDLTNRFRGGDRVMNVTGVMDYSHDLYRIQPTKGASYQVVNPRPATPPDVGGSLKVVSMNVLNYFSTLGSRGADTIEEFQRQRAKTIAAIIKMNPDIAGLVEIENNDDALIDLVAGLNDATAAGTYAYIPTGPIGKDEIKVALIYKPATVSPMGAYAILDSSVDPRFLDDYNRPVLAQTFIATSSGGVFTVAVNHLKSKGSDCNAVADPDLGDGAGNCNLTRLTAAQAEVDWLASDPTGSNDTDFMIIGDLNSYDKEAPIDAILAGADDTPGTADDFVDMLYTFQGEHAYSYVFDGQMATLITPPARAWPRRSPALMPGMSTLMNLI